MQNPARAGVTFALLATCLWSTTGLFIDRLVTGYHLAPVQLSFWRALLVALALGAALVRRERAAFRLSRRELPYYLLYGLVGVAVFNVIWSASVEVNKAAVATALVFSAPVFVAFGGWAVFGERLAVAQGGAIAVNVVGCALVAGVSDPAALTGHLDGLALGLASGLAFGAYTLFGKGAARVGPRDSLSILFYVFVLSAADLLVWGLATEGPALLRPPLDPPGWGLLLALALGPTLGGYSCFTVSLRTLPVAVASLFTTLEPPITAVLAQLVLGRTMAGIQWLGTGLIVGGVLVMQGGVLARRHATRHLSRQAK